MKKHILLVALAATMVLGGCGQTAKPENDELAAASTVKLWGGDRHCAFTSIAEFKGRYYISFREAESHIFDSDGEARGAVRILSSSNGNDWESVAYLTEEGIDLRDPKLSVTADGRLMVIIGGSKYVGRKAVGRHPRVSFSDDGKNFTAPEKVNISSKTANGDDWIWRVDWHGGVGYGVMYSNIPGAGKAAALSLLKTADGINYEDVANLDLPDFPNETTVHFFPDGRMAMMVREDAGDCLGYWGVSEAPYTQWNLQKMDMRVGGPDFYIDRKGRVVMATRDYREDGKTTTVIRKGDASGEFTDVVTLPSAGDCSYPGIIRVGRELWISYYSTHETEKAAVYLTRLPLKMFR